jgi:hypothetical protein
MSREQRRLDRKQQARGAAPTRPRSSGAPTSRRTPVKVAGGSRVPMMALAIGGGVVLLVALIAYLIFQATKSDSGLTAWEKAEQDSSPSIPGGFYPTQGRGHFPGNLEGHVMTPFCDGVSQSAEAQGRNGVPFSSSGTPVSGTTGAAGTPTASGPTTTPVPTETPDTSHGTPNTTPTVPTNCYSSNPPSSGKHLNVQHNANVGNGNLINIPPDPDVYPEPVEIPRDAIPHILEHAGVYVGYHCADGDSDCQAVIDKLRDLVNDRIENHSNRVVMALDTDLPAGIIGISSWTRSEQLSYKDWDASAKKEIDHFIDVNSCRFDPEGFCR